MLSFEEIKKAIQATGENSTYFTKDFYNTYIAAQTDADGWKMVHNSKFYNLNSTAYCVFLEIFNMNLPKYRVEIYVKDMYCNRLISTKYCKAFSETEAKTWAQNLIDTYYDGNYIAEVNKVA